MLAPQHKGQVGQYYLMEKLAQGGMAEIFKGLSYDVHGIKKTVCIKKILPHLAASEEFIGSLINEAKLAVRLVHGNIAQTFDLGKVGADYFMVMEFVDGKSLSQINKKCLARGKPIPIPFLVYFISEVLNGLGYMHRRSDDAGLPFNIVHRDISPQNIMVSYSGTVKIIDFGIAKAAYRSGSTDSGMLKGKFAYMSPEQALGDEIDQRSDIFSLGIILHEMLTGKRLFKAEDARETIRNVRRAKVSPPSTLRPEVPDELDAITMRSLTKDRRRRYATAADMNEDLVKFLHTSSPEFKHSDAADFVRELFEDDLASNSPEEADARTPHLIIDRSNSALADDSQFEATGQAPVNLNFKDYMLEEETAIPKLESPEPHEADDPESPKSLAVIESSHERTPIAKKGMFRGKWSRSIVKGIVVGVTLFAILTAIRIGLRKSPEEKRETFSPTSAQIMVTTTPADAEVRLDGKSMGHGSPVTMNNVEAGKQHSLTVLRDGYLPHERTVTLTRGEFASIAVELKPAAPPTATLELSSTPPGAKVFLDDAESSLRTPTTLPSLSTARKHTIGFYLEGYRFWTKELELKPGETRTIEVSLTRDFGSLLVDSVPQKALVLIDGTPAGQTPFTRDDLIPGKVYKIEVWQEGFAGYSEEIKAEAGRKLEIRTTLKPESAPIKNPK